MSVTGNIHPYVIHACDPGRGGKMVSAAVDPAEASAPTSVIRHCPFPSWGLARYETDDGLGNGKFASDCYQLTIQLLVAIDS
jgi:hypothetical protein